MYGNRPDSIPPSTHYEPYGMTGTNQQMTGTNQQQGLPQAQPTQPYSINQPYGQSQPFYAENAMPMPSVSGYMKEPGIPNRFPISSAVKLKEPNSIELVYSADLFGPTEQDRRYVYILENGLEQNVTYNCCYNPSPPCPSCCCIFDGIKKWHFDRGPFDRQSMAFCTGWLSGEGEIYANEVKHVCFCQECPVCYNELRSCYFAACCGERVRYMPAQYACCCISLKAGCCTNCCGIMGPKDGEPLYLVPIANCLDVGAGAKFVEMFKATRDMWKQRSGATM